MGRRAAAGAVSDRLILARQHEINVDLRDHFNWVTIQQRRPVEPLLDGLLRGGYQQRVAVNECDAADMAVLRNDDVEAHNTLDTGLPGEGWIDGINLAEQVRLLDGRSDADALNATRRGWRRWILARCTNPGKSRGPLQIGRVERLSAIEQMLGIVDLCRSRWASAGRAARQEFADGAHQDGVG